MMLSASALARRSLRPLCHGSLLHARRTLSISSSADVFDVLIVGGGAVGATLTKVLGESCTGLRVGVVERSSAPKSLSNNNGIPHPRAYALSPHALQLIANDVTSQLQLGYYKEMQVWEQDSPSCLLFSFRDLLGTSAELTEALGAVVEDAPLVHALWSRFGENTSTFAAASIESLVLPQHADELVSVELKQHDSIHSVQTRLLVAADGANSSIRQACGIPWLGWDYGRTAVTFTVSVESMPKRAYQRFLPNGPLALLPTYNPMYATIVWSTTPQHAKQLQQVPQQDLIQEINNILQVGPERIPSLLSESNGWLGGVKYGAEKLVDTLQYGMTMSHWSDSNIPFLVPPLVQSVEGRLFSFQLSCRQAKSYVDNRVALVGDAAHTVHPMAGQGLNLGMHDVDGLVQTIKEAYASGMDVGHAHFLNQYNSQRQVHNTAALAGIHALHSVFGVERGDKASLPNLLLHQTKSLGMGVCNHVGPIRRQLAKVAAGAL